MLVDPVFLILEHFQYTKGSGQRKLTTSLHSFILRLNL
jgi:hypothetical protein